MVDRSKLYAKLVSKQMCRYILLVKIALCKTWQYITKPIAEKHSTIRTKRHRNYSEIPTLSTFIWTTHLNISHVFEKGLVDNQRKIILTIICQITGKNAVMNSDILWKDEWGKEEETTISPHCELKTAWI